MLTRRNFLTGCACCGLAITTSVLAEDTSAPALSITPLSDDVWLHTTWKLLANNRPFPSTGLIIRGTQRGLLIDTTWPTADMPPLLDQMATLAPQTAFMLVCTHAHDDRMSGVGIARARGIRSLVHGLTQEDAPARGLPSADDTWREQHKILDLGGRIVELFYPGPAHTRDNIVAFIPDLGILFGGCMFRAAEFSIGNTADADLGAYAGSVGRVIDKYGRDVRIVVPGHGRHGGPELLQHTLDLAVAAAK